MTEITINCPVMGREEVAAAASVIRGGALTSAANEGGTHVRAFEQAAASFVGTKYAIAVNSGTAALQAALCALDIGPNDEVLVPSFTFVATANAVVSVGARPVFVDISRENYTMDAADLERKITKKTRAIIPVHLYGHIADIKGIAEISKKYSIPVIEDAAQSLGSTYRNRQTGSFFEMGCFSMYAGKIMTSGEGGFITTDKKKLRDRLRMVRNHGMHHGYDTKVYGMNLRLPEINAAIARVQMGRLPKFLSVRRQNSQILSELLAGTGDLVLPVPKKHENPNYSLYTISSSRRNAIQKALSGKKSGRSSPTITPAKSGHLGGDITIHAAIYYHTPVHKTPFYRNALPVPYTLANTDWAASSVLSLPVHPKVRHAHLRIMAKRIQQCFES